MKEVGIQIIVSDCNEVIQPYSSFRSDSRSHKVNNALIDTKDKPISDLEMILDFQTKIYDQLNSTLDSHS